MKPNPTSSFARLVAGLLLVTATAVNADDRPDLVIADFESETYGDWKVEGTAFGPGPAEGSIGKQMKVSGFQGQRLANSFFGGDASTGTLTSPAFTIERRFLNFLVGGGSHAGQTCIHLRVDGQVVRSATGPNPRPGATEALEPATWDVSELIGKTATLQVIDQRQGGWGCNRMKR
jgi:hypothetical protein